MLAWTWLDIFAWVSTPIIAALGACFGAYIGKRAERRAIAETMDAIERRAADITEAAKLRWSRRAEVCSALYGHLIMAAREFRSYLSPNTPSLDEAVEQLRLRCKVFDDHFAEHALFLPENIKERVEWIAEEYGRVFNVSTLLRPARPLLESGESETPQQEHVRQNHYKQKEKMLVRFQDGGDIAIAVKDVERRLRASLEVE